MNKNLYRWSQKSFNSQATVWFENASTPGFVGIGFCITAFCAFARWVSGRKAANRAGNPYGQFDRKNHAPRGVRLCGIAAGKPPLQMRVHILRWKLSKAAFAAAHWQMNANNRVTARARSNTIWCAAIPRIKVFLHFNNWHGRRRRRQPALRGVCFVAHTAATTTTTTTTNAARNNTSRSIHMILMESRIWLHN